MSIESAITNAQGKVANAYVAISNKGGTLPATQNLSNMPTAISSIPEATEPTLASLTVTPSTTAQTLTPPSGTDGYNTVTVSAVTSSIDSDIQAGNIKSGVNILGVTGTVTALAGETRTVSVTSTSGNTFTPSSGKNGITSIKCNPTNKALTITPTTTSQTFTVPSNYSGYGTVTCSASSGGITPTGTYSITANGTYDVTNYASANVNVSGGGSFVGIPREVSQSGVYQMPTSNFTFSLPSNATDVDSTVLYAALNNSSGLTSVDLSSLTSASGARAFYNAFYKCPDLISVDLSNLETVSSSSFESAFDSSSSLSTVNLSNLTTVSGDSAFQNAFKYTAITSVDLSNLTTVSGMYAFDTAFAQDPHEGQVYLQSVNFSSLASVTGAYAFRYTFSEYLYRDISSINFPNLTVIGDNIATGKGGQFTGAFSRSRIVNSDYISVTFNKLEAIYCTGTSSTLNALGTFEGNNIVQKFYFPKLSTITYGSGASSSNQAACQYIFRNCSNLTELHFGAANRTAIEATEGYSTAWGRGAGNVTIYFDL